MSSKNVKSPGSKFSSAHFFVILGLILLSFGLAILVFTFYPVLVEEANYAVKSSGKTSPVKVNEAIRPVDEAFSIVIPKINANSKVIANVDPFDSNIYQRELTKGVAHAKGTALPNQPGNSFIFAHSAGNILEANRYNSVFYLLNKLEPGDDIYVFFEKVKLRYKVTNKKTVLPSGVSYLSTNISGGRTLTLMTCWPAGTTLRRLIIEASPVGSLN